MYEHMRRKIMKKGRAMEPPIDGYRREENQEV
jgi:hypothetical protein